MGESIIPDGTLDAFFFSGGLPVAAVTDLSRRVAIRLLDVSAVVAKLRLAYGEFYAERTIPVSAYGLPAAVTTIGVPNYLVVGGANEYEYSRRAGRLLFMAPAHFCMQPIDHLRHSAPFHQLNVVRKD